MMKLVDIVYILYVSLIFYLLFTLYGAYAAYFFDLCCFINPHQRTIAFVGISCLLCQLEGHVHASECTSLPRPPALAALLGSQHSATSRQSAGKIG